MEAAKEGAPKALGAAEAVPEKTIDKEVDEMQGLRARGLCLVGHAPRFDASGAVLPL